LHAEAVKITRLLIANNWSLLLPYEVLAESLNALGKLISKDTAEIVGNTLMQRYSRQEFTFVPSQPQILQAGLEKIHSAPGGPSFIDCLVMAHADEQQTTYIFGFDATFKKNSYKLPS
jgi:predicted nucleic acid-binding protein